jgi:two-component system chemotaxis response regulator CheY
LRILIAMDPSQDREALVAAIAELRVESWVAPGPDELLAALERETSIAALLLGGRLGGRDSLPVLRTVRADARWKALPVLLVIEVADLARAAETQAAGVSEYLQRPHDAQSLLEKLLMLGVDPEAREAA